MKLLAAQYSLNKLGLASKSWKSVLHKKKAAAKITQNLINDMLITHNVESVYVTCKMYSILNLRTMVTEREGSGRRFIGPAFFLPSKRKNSLELPKVHRLVSLPKTYPHVVPTLHATSSQVWNVQYTTSTRWYVSPDSKQQRRRNF